MSDEGQVPDELRTPRWRFWGDRQPPKNRAEVFSVRAETAAGSDSSTVATIRMHGPIDSWGGPWGISAKDVSSALDQLGDQVTEVRLRVNSPGGEVWEGMAILNALRAHQAKVVAVVDGLAASAASFIVAAADERVMSPGTQMMIHDASAFAIGNAETMAKAQRMLDSTSDSIASIYADAAGGTAEEWRAAMREETWYTADEAVAAGLADRVAVVRDAGVTGTVGDGQAAPDDLEDRFAAAAARFDLSIFTHAGRGDAPAPKLPAASAGGSTTHERSAAVAFTDEQLTAMRDKLGLPETADEAAILAAVNAVVDESLEDRPSSTGTPAAPAAPSNSGPATPAAPVANPSAPGTMTIDVSAWDAIQERTKRLEAADAKRRREERDQVIDQAVREGKFPVARKDHWTRLWDADPEGTRNVIDGLTKNVVPVDEVGHSLDDDAIDDEFAHLFPPTTKGA